VDPDRQDPLRARIRWDNVARAAVLALLAVAIAAWPRLAPREPALPPAQPVPVAPATPPAATAPQPAGGPIASAPQAEEPATAPAEAPRPSSRRSSRARQRAPRRPRKPRRRRVHRQRAAPTLAPAARRPRSTAMSIAPAPRFAPAGSTTWSRSP
jgi:hypothetical protein